MGLFGGDDEPDNQQQQINNLIEQQYRDIQIEIETKRRNLVQTRMDAIKSQGEQQWQTPVNYGQTNYGMPSKSMRPGGGGMSPSMIDNLRNQFRGQSGN